VQAVRQVSAGKDIHRENLVAGLERCEITGHVRLAAGMRLDVGVLGREERTRPVNRQGFNLVYILAASVISPAGIAFGIFIREDRTGELHNLSAHDILRRYKPYRVFLFRLLIL